MTSTIKRLENLKDPDREVDAEIAKAIGWRDFISDKVPAYYWIDEENRPRLEVPYFTGSIDAALTLMPKINRPNFPWLAIKSNNPNNPIGCRCELWLDNVKNYNGRGKTLAIAICIAALKARETGNVQIPD